MGELKYLNKYLFRYRYRLALGAVFVIISNYFGVIPAKIIRRAFDLVNENITLYKLFSGFSNQDSIYQIFGKTMLIFGASVLLMAILRGIFLFLCVKPLLLFHVILNMI